MSCVVDNSKNKTKAQAMRKTVCVLTLRSSMDISQFVRNNKYPYTYPFKLK